MELLSGHRVSWWVRSQIIHVWSLIAIGRVILAFGNTWLAGLVDIVSRGSRAFSSDALYFLHGGRHDFAGDASDSDISTVLEAPTLNGQLLTTIGITLAGTDRVDHGMSAHIPALVAGKVAMPGRVSDERVTSDETRPGHA